METPCLLSTDRFYSWLYQLPVFVTLFLHKTPKSVGSGAAHKAVLRTCLDIDGN